MKKVKRVSKKYPIRSLRHKYGKMIKGQTVSPSEIDGITYHKNCIHLQRRGFPFVE